MLPGGQPADAAWWTEGLAALFDADGPHIPGPDVHILKELKVDRSQVREIICAVTQKVGSLAEFDNTCLDEIVLRVLQCVRCLGTDSVSQDASARDEIALPVPFEIAGVPGVRHSWPGYWTLYRRRTRSRSSAAVIAPRA